jgi:hypothetical protein
VPREGPSVTDLGIDSVSVAWDPPADAGSAPQGLEYLVSVYAAVSGTVTFSSYSGVGAGGAFAAADGAMGAVGTGVLGAQLALAGPAVVEACAAVAAGATDTLATTTTTAAATAAAAAMRLVAEIVVPGDQHHRATLRPLAPNTAHYIVVIARTPHAPVSKPLVITAHTLPPPPPRPSLTARRDVLGRVHLWATTATAAEAPGSGSLAAEPGTAVDTVGTVVELRWAAQREDLCFETDGGSAVKRFPVPKHASQGWDLRVDGLAGADMWFSMVVVNESGASEPSFVWLFLLFFSLDQKKKKKKKKLTHTHTHMSSHHSPPPLPPVSYPQPPLCVRRWSRKWCSLRMGRSRGSSRAPWGSSRLPAPRAVSLR